MSTSSTIECPRPGMFATVRNRRGVVSGVEPYDDSGRGGRLHLVQVEYQDDQLPVSERLLWELEPCTRLIEPTALPGAGAARSEPMPADEFDAMLRAARWSAASPCVDPGGDGAPDLLPIVSPFHAAVQVEDFQLVPLLKALKMPRVSLLIADDVGLGKTVEAGLILSELLIRRRIQRVLILTPASLRLQWRDEMWDKFALSFDLVDHDQTHALRRRLGMDANPWRSFSRIIASYHYLRADDVLEQFMAACRVPEGSPHLPWDLLIVDECHNLMPSSFGDDSDLCRMLRLVAPQFEHRLFLSATPHNGHMRCFTGLLEMLDPVRFTQASELKPADQPRVQEVVLRRLKRDINARTNPPKFCTRNQPRALVLTLSEQEIALSAAFDSFRRAIRNLMAGADRRRRAGSFAVEVLGKRLLSCPTAFAESWRRCKEGLGEERAASESDVDSARRSLQRETGDDRESQSKLATAAGVVGAWLKGVAVGLKSQIAALDAAVDALQLDSARGDLVEQNPLADARFDALDDLIERLLCSGGTWRDDERLVVFTEYKTTLDYLARRLRERYELDRILMLFGGMDEFDRDEVKRAFNDPSHPARVLLGTDAASEGLNLQRTARFLLHFDCPWNPSKLEQRNGRLDRHGQARDVSVHHFVTDQDQDLKFLGYVIAKAHEIRDDLGSANELFDEAAHRRLVEGESLIAVQAELDRGVTAAHGRAVIDADSTTATGAPGIAVHAAGQQLQAMAAELDLDPASLRDTLETAMANRAGRPQLECSSVPHIYKVCNPALPGWSEVIDESLRLGGPRTGHGSESGGGGAVARLAFSVDPFLQELGGRVVFCPRPDVSLMHLAHPMMVRALSMLTRRRFSGSNEDFWTVRLGHVPAGADALVLLHVEELAVNKLRETFHHWVRTLVFPVKAGMLGEPLPRRPALDMRGARGAQDVDHQTRARDLLEEVEPALQAALTAHAEQLTDRLREHLRRAGENARAHEGERYRIRQGEVSSLIAQNTMARLQREIEKLKDERRQGLLFDEAERFEAIDRSIEEKKAEIARRTRHYEDVRARLERERERIVEHLLPGRHALSGSAQVFPVCLEVRLPGGPP